MITTSAIGVMLLLAGCSHRADNVADSGTSDSGNGPSVDDGHPGTYRLLLTQWKDFNPVLGLGSLDGHFTAIRPLEGGVSGASQARLSPDGTRVAFVTFDSVSSSWELVVRSLANSGTEELVLAYTTFSARPAWSPDGKSIAYVSFSSDFTYSVYVVPSDGGDAAAIGSVRVDSAVQSICIAPQWSPDGAMLAYATIEGIASYRFADRSTHQLATIDAHTASDWTCQPQWSPDGSWIAFAWGSVPGHIMRVSQSGGTAPVPVTELGGGMPVGQVQWSPDGKQLAFTSYDDSVHDTAIYVVDAAGGPAMPLDHINCGVAGGHPAWSPDGGTLSYVRFDAGPVVATVSASGGAVSRTGLAGASIDGTYPSWLATPIPY
jgi:TolB protein